MVWQGTVHGPRAQALQKTSSEYAATEEGTILPCLGQRSMRRVHASALKHTPCTEEPATLQAPKHSERSLLSTNKLKQQTI